MSVGLHPLLLGLHALLLGAMTAFVLLIPRLVLMEDAESGAWPPERAWVAAGMAGTGAMILVLIVVARFGVEKLRAATLAPVFILLIFLFGIGPIGFGRTFVLRALPASKRTIEILDMAYSPRPLARVLDQISPRPGVIAVFRVRRDVEYGLSFYRDQRVADYDQGGVPAGRHLLVTRKAFAGDVQLRLAGRSFTPLFEYPEQNLLVYQVEAAR